MSLPIESRSARQPDAIDRAIAAVDARDALTIAFAEPETIERSLPTITKKRAGRLSGTIAATAIGASLLSSVDVQPATAQQFISIGGQMPSSAGFVFETAVRPQSQEKTNINEAIIKLRTREAAAKRFGGDEWSTDPRNWVINKDGSASLKTDPKGLVHRVNVAGAIIDANIWVDRPGNLPNRLPIVVYPVDLKEIDISSGTFRLFPKSQWSVEFNKQVAKTRIRERGKGTHVIPVCVPFIRPGDLEPVADSQLYQFKSSTNEGKRREAAALYGADAYTKNWENWEINEYGAAWLKQDNWRNPTANREVQVHVVKADEYTTFDGWVKAWRFKPEFDPVTNERRGYNAIPLVGHRTPPNPILFMEITSGTAWRSKPELGLVVARRLFHQVRRQQAERELKEQPGTAQIPICN